ncbi:hypothetical protein DFH06DRAFT_1130064 [Mycena polygramma]|nr:hypothetical protein DFH06DRAFT_1130064 [Mycena polygramma]
MPPQPSVTQTRLNNITRCLAAAATSLEVLASGLKEPSLEVIALTTKSLLKNLETVKQNKDQCIQLLEQTHELLNAILATHITSDTGADLRPSVLNAIAKFTETLHKINTFIEAQQKGSKLKRLFHQGELNTLLRNCKDGLQQGLDSFQIDAGTFMKEITYMQKESAERHKEVLHLIETLADTGSDEASVISRVFSGPHNSSTSISMLPSEPKIFHGRNSEVSNILQLLKEGAPKIAILGAGGMGKTTVATAILHHTESTAIFDQHRYFVACDSATTKVELAALIGVHLGLNPGKDLTQAVVQCFFSGPPSLLVLDNLETVWEPMQSRQAVEEFLSLLTDVKHLALMITMRGAERPAKVAWTHPFLPPLSPLNEDAARQTFMDIADDAHDSEELDKVLALTDNIPLAISLLAHLVDSKGCSMVLSRWEEEKTSMVSDGHDKRSNLELSISLSLSSPRLKAFPHALELLTLLSMLPNGLSDVELVQSRLPLDNILGCKATLIRTSLAYSDFNKRLKVLVPIREYMMKIQPPKDNLIRPLRRYFQELLELHKEYHGTSTASSTVARISPNLANIQNVLENGLKPDHPELVDCIYCTCYLSQFSRSTTQGEISLLLRQIPNVFPAPCDHRLEAYYASELLNSQRHMFIGDVDTVITQGLIHIEYCNDPDVQCWFYLSLATVYIGMKHDLSVALDYGQTALSLASSVGNTKRHSQALYLMAWANWFTGACSTAQDYSKECQRVAKISADLYGEASGLSVEAKCCCRLGDYTQSLALSIQTRHLLASCAMSHSEMNYNTMNSQAEVHKLKSEYSAARDIHCQICEQAIQDPSTHGLALLNIAEIDVSIDSPDIDVQRNVDVDLSLREGDLLAAKALFLDCINSSDSDAPMLSYCLERLGDASRWGSATETLSWTTVLLAHSLKHKEKLLILKALLSFGQIFHHQADEDTAINLFNVALAGFTQMDIHRSRGECMLHLGDIYKGRGESLKAVELWDTARPLFERSSQGKQVKKIDERLASVGAKLLEKHRQSLAYLSERNAPSGPIVPEQEDGSSDEEDLDVVKEEKGLYIHCLPPSVKDRNANKVQTVPQGCTIQGWFKHYQTLLQAIINAVVVSIHKISHKQRKTTRFREFPIERIKNPKSTNFSFILSRT